MFESKPAKPASPPPEIIVAAPNGCSLFYFDPPHGMKASALTLAELMAQRSFPVVAFRVVGNTMEPLTICDLPCVTKYLFTPTKIFELGPTPTCWADREQWQMAVLNSWKIIRRIPDPPTPARGPATISPGQTAVIFRQ